VFTGLVVAVDGLVGPSVVGWFGRSGPACEAFRVLGVGAVERDLPLGSDLLGGAEMHRGGSVHPDPGVSVFLRGLEPEPEADHRVSAVQALMIRPYRVRQVWCKSVCSVFSVVGLGC
jgi:hypothetical protein